ncbi:MAG: A24 family peptidase [Elusimicrobiota bacterium]
MLKEYLTPVNITLLFLIITTTFTDLKYQKIYNHFTFPCIILGWGFNLMENGFIEGFYRTAFLGFLAGGALLFIFYMAGGMGAGDVKFLAAVGALKGPHFVFNATLHGAILGGVFTVLYLLFTGHLIETISNTATIIYRTLTLKKLNVQSKEMEGVYLPYGFFLSLGVVSWFLINKL